MEQIGFAPLKVKYFMGFWRGGVESFLWFPIVPYGSSVLEETRPPFLLRKSGGKKQKNT